MNPDPAYQRGQRFGRTRLGRALLPVVRAPLELLLGVGYAVALTGFAVSAQLLLRSSKREARRA